MRFSTQKERMGVKGVKRSPVCHSDLLIGWWLGEEQESHPAVLTPQGAYSDSNPVHTCRNWGYVIENAARLEVRDVRLK